QARLGRTKFSRTFAFRPNRPTRAPAIRSLRRRPAALLFVALPRSLHVKMANALGLASASQASRKRLIAPRVLNRRSKEEPSAHRKSRRPQRRQRTALTRSEIFTQAQIIERNSPAFRRAVLLKQRPPSR